MSLNMSKAEREAFLTGVHVAVVSVEDPGHGPLSIPVWYRYEPGGDVFFTTGASSRKAALIREAGRVSLCVQTETAPYQYVTVEGPATLESPDSDRDVRAIAVRYLGEQGGAAYLKSTGAGGEGSVLVRLHPERWLTVDYGKRSG